MVFEDFSQLQHKWACVQFIAEVSLLANCKPSDLKLALSLIADLTHEASGEAVSNIYYEAE